MEICVCITDLQEGGCECTIKLQTFKSDVCTSKLLEHIICSHTRGHLDKFGALVPNNHGFRKSLSCDTQLVLTLQDLFTRRHPPRSRIDVAVLDFDKAFDKVPHHRLMNKLRTYGIGGDVANWIRAFLNEHTQQVVVDGCKSDSAAVTSGVP